MSGCDSELFYFFAALYYEERFCDTLQECTKSGNLYVYLIVLTERYCEGRYSDVSFFGRTVL